MKNFEIGYKDKKIQVRESDEENALLQAFTFWKLQDSKTLRKNVKVKTIKRIF